MQNKVIIDYLNQGFPLTDLNYYQNWQFTSFRIKLIQSSKDIFCHESVLKDLQKIELECYLLKNSQQNNTSYLELNIFVLNMLCKEKSFFGSSQHD